MTHLHSRIKVGVTDPYVIEFRRNMEEDDFDALPTKLKAKKKIRNAFFFFMQDLKAQWIRNGKLSPNTTMAEMPAIASPVWQVQMSYAVFVRNLPVGWVEGRISRP